MSPGVYEFLSALAEGRDRRRGDRSWHGECAGFRSCRMLQRADLPLKLSSIWSPIYSDSFPSGDATIAIALSST